MSTLNNHIDPLQTSLQEKFADYSFDIDIDVDFIIKESRTASTSAASSASKYWIAGSIISTGIVVASFLIFNSNESPIEPQKNVVSEKITPIKVEQPVNQPIELKAEKVEIIKEVEPKKINKTTLTKITETTIKEEVISENKTIKEEIIVKEEIKEETKNISFDDFIKKKSKDSKDSIHLFLKKK